MKILLVNKFHYLRGGDCRYVFELANMLEKKGHEIRHFSMKHPKNIYNKHEIYFVSYIDFLEELKKTGIKPKLNVLLRMLYSKEAREKFGKAIDDFKPDIIHLNNIHKHLTTSIILEANKKHIPLIWTLHDYNLICPNISFISHNKICEKCKNLKYLSPVLEKCSNNSRAASSIIALESILHNIQSIKKRVNYFISPSNFLKNKFYEYGFEKNKIIVLPNFSNNKRRKHNPQLKPRYFLYLGRISQEKGIETLCKAAKDANILLKVVGDGPLKQHLENKYKSKRINFLGYKSGTELENLRKNAWFLVIPSEWYENNPYSVIESFSDKVPVIGANIGGIPELVIDNKTGFLFKSGDVNSLKELLIKSKSISNNERNKLGNNGNKNVKLFNNPNTYYNNLIKIYNKAIKEEKLKWKHS